MSDWRPGSLLGMLSDAARDDLLQRGSLVRYPGPVKVLFREADESRFVVVILRGVVKITGSTSGRLDALLAIRMGGDAVGEFAAVDRLPRSATATTCGPLIARIIKAGDFLDSIRRNPDISHAVNKSIVAKMRVASARRVEFSGSDVPTRVARVLLQFAQSYGIRDGNKAIIASPLTQTELASLAVASPPTVHRVLRRLRDNGIVATRYRSITVLDIDGLRHAASV
jgi:CRP/FNR family transcriptional regulator, cyclic AMP receptor protein